MTVIDGEIKGATKSEKGAGSNYLVGVKKIIQP
jgi:hypothetical protein